MLYIYFEWSEVIKLMFQIKGRIKFRGYMGKDVALEIHGFSGDVDSNGKITILLDSVAAENIRSYKSFEGDLNKIDKREVLIAIQ